MVNFKVRFNNENKVNPIPFERQCNGRSKLKYLSLCGKKKNQKCSTCSNLSCKDHIIKNRNSILFCYKCYNYKYYTLPYDMEIYLEFDYKGVSYDKKEYYQYLNSKIQIKTNK
jgi:hypothetical protein